MASIVENAVGPHRQTSAQPRRLFEDVREGDFRGAPARFTPVVPTGKVDDLIVRPQRPLHDLDRQHGHHAASAPIRIEPGCKKPEILSHCESELAGGRFAAYSQFKYVRLGTRCHRNRILGNELPIDAMRKPVRMPHIHALGLGAQRMQVEQSVEGALHVGWLIDNSNLVGVPVEIEEFALHAEQGRWPFEAADRNSAPASMIPTCRLEHRLTPPRIVIDATFDQSRSKDKRIGAVGSLARYADTPVSRMSEEQEISFELVETGDL